MSTKAEAVLILTPMKNTSGHLDTYFRGLSSLTYPHTKLSLGILEGDSADDTYVRTNERLAGLDFHRTAIFKKDFNFRIPPGVPRWTDALQPTRRSVLARARNHLLFRALDDEDWVLWLDADVIAYPPDIIERLLAVGGKIVHPHCVIEPGGRTFDLNAWRDGGKQTMQDLRGQGRTRLDAVGGTMLLVNADCHRDGLIFPPFFYGNRNASIRDPHPLGRGILGEIETEGLGIMAQDMRIDCWGVPDLEIFHAC